MLTTHIFSTFFMTGLCWFIQVIHYPQFKRVEQEKFSKFYRYNFKTLLIAGPLMITEIFTGFMLLKEKITIILLINGFLIFITVASTFLIQIPLHLRLMLKKQDHLIDRLIKTNWIRTFSWTIRSIILIYFISS